MDPTALALLVAGIAVVAFLYASVGHAGASGYIAVLTLASFAPAEIKPISLVLNILVATIGSYAFWRAGHFSWRLFWPFALLAIPAAFLGGYLQLPSQIFRPLLGAVLWFSAARLLLRKREPETVAAPPLPIAMASGAGIGLLSGLTGTGGGIFLTPLLLFCHWAHVRTAASISALFILLNSAAGLSGHLASGRGVPPFAWILALAAVAGGTAGAHLGSRRFPARTIATLLAVVLTIAGAKLVFS